MDKNFLTVLNTCHHNHSKNAILFTWLVDQAILDVVIIDAVNAFKNALVERGKSGAIYEKDQVGVIPTKVRKVACLFRIFRQIYS